MKLSITLVAALAVCPHLLAQDASGSLNGSGPVLQANADGTVGNAPVFPNDHKPGPLKPPGTTDAPVLGPQEDGCVTLNNGGGSLSTTTFLTGRWFVHKVVAPRNMRVASFEFFCRASSSVKVNTGLFLDSSGKPASSPVRTSTMSVSTSAGFRRSTLSSSYYMSKGRVFYIGYTIPTSGKFYVDLTGGANTAYFWGPPVSSTWTGPITSRKAAWRVNCYDPGTTWTFGSSCNTASSRGQGQGSWATGLNVEATTNNSRSWVANGRFQFRIVAPRDMYVDGASFLSRVTSGSANCTVEMYLGNGTSSSPGTRVRSGTTRLTTTSRWNRASWTPYFVKKGTIYYVGYVAPTNMRISTDDGASTTYYYRSPTASSFGGPYSYDYIKFPVRVHTQYCENENVLASSNATTSFIRGAKFMHQHVADSDQWVSGFGFRCRVASGSATVRFEMRLADRNGRPLNSAVRAVNRSVTSSSSYRDVHFTPVFVPRGATYYVGYVVPTSTSVTLYPRASGTTYNTYYYWQQPTGTTWSGYGSYAFARRIYSSRTQLNPYTTANSTSQFVPNAYFVFQATAPDDMWVSGFELFADLNSGSANATTVLYRANGSGGSPGSLVRTGSMGMNTANVWRKSHFETPYYFAKGTKFYVGIRTPSSSTIRLRFRASSGSNANYFWRPATQATWNGGTTGFNTPVGFKVHGHTGAARLVYSGIPEIGKSVQVKLVGASTSRIYGLLFSPSATKWGPITLPWDLPFWSGCKLYVGYDSLLATGSTGSSGTGTVTIPVPNAKNLINLRFYNQFWVLERTGSSLEMSWTNGGGVRIGG